MTANCTSLSTIICRVQRPCPSGGSLQAIIVTLALTLLSILMGRPLRGASWSTSSMCSCCCCRYLFCTLYTVPREIPNIVVRSCSGLPSSKSNKTRARLIARALFVPWATNFSIGLVLRRLIGRLDAFSAYSSPPDSGEYTESSFDSSKTFVKDHLSCSSRRPQDVLWHQNMGTVRLVRARRRITRAPPTMPVSRRTHVPGSGMGVARPIKRNSLLSRPKPRPCPPG
jgi:hypothetical protein